MTTKNDSQVFSKSESDLPGLPATEVVPVPVTDDFVEWLTSRVREIAATTVGADLSNGCEEHTKFMHPELADTQILTLTVHMYPSRRLGGPCVHAIAVNAEAETLLNTYLAFS